MLKLLLKTRLLAMMDRVGGQKKSRKAATAGKLALMALGGLVVLILIGGLVGLLASPLYAGLRDGGMTWLIFALAGTLACVLSFVFTMFYAQGAIFEAKDNELLLSMPIPPSAILGSRMGALYFLNLLFSVTIMGAVGVLRAMDGGLQALHVIIFLVCIPLLALIGTTLSCLLGWLVSLITRRMRHKALFSLLLSLAFMGFYFYAMLGLSDHLQAILANSGNIADAFRRVLLPFYAMAMAIAEGDLTQLLIFAACCAVPFALVYFLLSRSFIRIVTTKVGAKRTEYKGGPLKESSAIWSLTKKDLTRFFNSSTYMLNCGLGLIFSLIMGIATLVSGNALLNFLLKTYARMEDAGSLAPYLIPVVLGVLAGMAYICAPSISVEGKNFWILDSLPLKVKDILKSKLLFHLVIAVPFSLVSSLLVVIAIPMDAMQVVIVFLFPLLAHVFCATVSMVAGLYTAKLDFPSEAKAVKSTACSLVPMVATAAVSLVPSILYFSVLKEQGVDFGTILMIAMGVMALISIAAYAFLLSPAAEKRWHSIKK